MNKINGYDAVIVRGTPRFRLNNKMIARDKVPEAIQQELIATIMDKDSVRTVNPAPDVAATFTTETPPAVVPEDTDDIGEGENPYIEAGAPEAYPPIKEETIDSNEVPAKFSELEEMLLNENENLRKVIAELSENTKQVQTARDFGNDLLSSFGIYTALASRDPQVGDIHPFTLQPMNRYDVGLAYVARKRSSHVDESALVPSVETTQQVQPNPVDNGGFKSFEERTGVSFGAETSAILRHHVNDPISDEATAEPNLRGTTIRPYW